MLFSSPLCLILYYVVKKGNLKAMTHLKYVTSAMITHEYRDWGVGFSMTNGISRTARLTNRTLRSLLLNLGITK